jgi:hypothetical protein
VRNEIKNELTYVGEENFTDVDKLAIGKFDSVAYVHANVFLKTLRQYYGNKISKASEKKEERIAQLTSTEVKRLAYNAQRMAYSNEAVTDAVLNTATPDRIVEFDGELIQKIYPIYRDDHKPRHIFDFSANLYQPTKHFAGVSWNTLYFNIVVIWSMTTLLFIALYFDVLKRLIKRLDGNRKYKKKTDS